METNKKKAAASVLKSVAEKTLSSAANSRCTMIYHQPKQPKALKNFRKF